MKHFVVSNESGSKEVMPSGMESPSGKLHRKQRQAKKLSVPCDTPQIVKCLLLDPGNPLPSEDVTF